MTPVTVGARATPNGPLPTVNVPSTAPSLALSFMTLLLPLFATQMLAPSKAIPAAPSPTVKVPSTAPSLVRSFVTLLLKKFATQTLAPAALVLVVKIGRAHV